MFFSRTSRTGVPPIYLRLPSPSDAASSPNEPDSKNQVAPSNQLRPCHIRTQIRVFKSGSFRRNACFCGVFFPVKKRRRLLQFKEPNGSYPSHNIVSSKKVSTYDNQEESSLGRGRSVDLIGLPATKPSRMFAKKRDHQSAPERGLDRCFLAQGNVTGQRPSGGRGSRRGTDRWGRRASSGRTGSGR
jgi:hypothetical protein